MTHIVQEPIKDLPSEVFKSRQFFLFGQAAE